MTTRIDSLEDFVRLSAALTGFQAVELRGTGLVESYFDTGVHVEVAGWLRLGLAEFWFMTAGGP